jgi:protein SCO1
VPARATTRVLVLLLGVVLATFTAAAGRAAGGPGPPFAGPTLTHPAPPPDFALRDQYGHLVRLSALRGKVVLLTFLYTHCPDVCPLTANNLNSVLARLGPARADVRVLAVSVDPKGDTPTAVKAFIRSHRLRPQFHYLTGTEKVLRSIWRAYKVQAVP